VEVKYIFNIILYFIYHIYHIIYVIYIIQHISYILNNIYHITYIIYYILYIIYIIYLGCGKEQQFLLKKDHLVCKECNGRIFYIKRSNTDSQYEAR
jgi:DNA-directed RNA polymerase subunit RPC12/RpoP